MNNSFKHIGKDLPASIVVLLVALPLCLGIALGSNAPLFSGIIGGIVGGIVIGALSGSQLSVSGPAAGLTVIVATAITKIGVYEAFLLSVVMAGVLQIIFGILKLGLLGDYVPNSVIKGMLAAIGLILILKQFPHLVGYDADFEGDERFIQSSGENTFTGVLHAINFITPTALVVGVVGILILIAWESPMIKKNKWLSQVPGPLLVVLAGISINEVHNAIRPNWALGKEHLVSLPIAQSSQEFLSFFTLPDLSYLTNPQVWIAGFTIAIVASLETLLSIEAIDKLDPYQRVTPNNRELKAQGMGNIVSGMLGGLPLTSVIVRSSANVNSGGITKMSAILHGVFLLLAVILIPGLLNRIPLSALAAVLIYTGYKLAKMELFKEYYAKGWDQFIPFIATIIAILFTDLLVGILVGILVGLFYMVRSNFRSAILVVNDGNNYLFRLRKDVSFLNKSILRQKLEQVPENSYIIIDTTRADFIDKDIIDTINEYLSHAALKNIRIDIKKNYYKANQPLFQVPDTYRMKETDLMLEHHPVINTN